MLDNTDAVIAKVDELRSNLIVLLGTAEEFKLSFEIEVLRQIDPRQTHLRHFAYGAYHMAVRTLVRDHLKGVSNHGRTALVWKVNYLSDHDPALFTPWQTAEQLLERVL